MKEKLYLYHYYSDPLNPFRSYMDEGFSTPQDYASYAAHVDGVRMEGYHTTYFQKRTDREEQFRIMAVKKYGNTIRMHPIYTTLGEENNLFFRVRRHRFSIALPLEAAEDIPLLFFIGDSMGAREAGLQDRTFSYAEFSSLSRQQIQALMPSNPRDQYVEVQLWGDELTASFLPPRHTPRYFEVLSRAVLFTNCPDMVTSVSPSLSSAIKRLQRDGSFLRFRQLLYSGNPAFIPDGFMHGISHSVRCAFLALCLACEYGLTIEIALWTAKCTAYHDSGRTFTSAETRHAAMTVLAAKELFPVDETNDAFRVMRCHCKSKQEITASFGLDEREKLLYTIAQIIHDADTLDYIRFSTERGISCFNTQYLCLPQSQNYICLAFELFLRSLDAKNWIQDIFG